MKCPAENCTHDFDVFDFDLYFNEDKPVICPNCRNEVIPVMDYFIFNDDGDEQPFISELELKEPENE